MKSSHKQTNTAQNLFLVLFSGRFDYFIGIKRDGKYLVSGENGEWRTVEANTVSRGFHVPCVSVVRPWSFETRESIGERPYFCNFCEKNLPEKTPAINTC